MPWKTWYRHLWNSWKNSDPYSHWFFRYSVMYKTNSITYGWFFIIWHVSILFLNGFLYNLFPVLLLKNHNSWNLSKQSRYLFFLIYFSLQSYFSLCSKFYRSRTWHVFETALLDSGEILRLTILCKYVY